MKRSMAYAPNVGEESSPRVACTRLSADPGFLYLASDQLLQSTGVLEGFDLSEAADRSIVDENVWHRFASREVREPGA
jgi:hypothetical protein